MPLLPDLTYWLLAAAAEAVDRIHADVTAAGFVDLRPTHGFAFARMAPDGATVGELAEHLSVTKQAASQLADELVRKGYCARTAHPTDARARLIVLTARGWACTRAADAAAARLVERWAETLGAENVTQLRNSLAGVVKTAKLRPAAW